MIVLKNINGKETVDTVFRGRSITIRPKHCHILKKTEEGLAEAKYLVDTFGFVVNITSLLEEKK